MRTAHAAPMRSRPQPTSVGRPEKPKPGMLMDIAQRFNVDLTGVPAVGDSLRDLQAAAVVGAQPVLVLTGKGANTQATGGLPEGTLVFSDLAEAVRKIVQ